MARQQALALARPRSVPALRGAWRRAVLVGACVVALLGLLYLGARETPVFALRTVEVEGVPANVRRAILESLEETRGKSLVSLDGDAVVRRLEALPSVQSVTYDRAFPHTLRLVVVPEEPVAVVKQASNRWIVSVRGRVIGPASAAGAPDLPRLRYLPEAPLVAGEFVADEGTKTVLAALSKGGGDASVVAPGRSRRHGDETARCGTGSAEAWLRGTGRSRVSRRDVARSTSRFNQPSSLRLRVRV